MNGYRLRCSRPATRTRRVVVGSLALLLTTAVATVGCTGPSSPNTTTTPGSTTGEAARDPALVEALRRESDLLARAVALDLPDPARLLSSHVVALGRAIDTTPPPSVPPSPSVPPKAQRLPAFVRALDAAADATEQSVRTAVNGQSAVLLASVAASDATLATQLANPPDEPGHSSGSAAFAAAAAVPSPTAASSTTGPQDPAWSATPELLDAWQTSLGVEHAEVFAFGMVGGTLGSGNLAARWSLDAHRARRDALQDALVTAAATPTPAAAAYVPDRSVTSARAARRLAATGEREALASYAALITAADPTWRSTAAAWLRSSSLALLGWSGAVESLPGLAPSRG